MVNIIIRPHAQPERARGECHSWESRQERLLAAFASGEKCKNNIPAHEKWLCHLQSADGFPSAVQADGSKDSCVSQSPHPHILGCTGCSNFHSPSKLSLTCEVVLKAEPKGTLWLGPISESLQLSKGWRRVIIFQREPQWSLVRKNWVKILSCVKKPRRKRKWVN